MIELLYLPHSIQIFRLDFGKHIYGSRQYSYSQDIRSTIAHMELTSFH